MTELPADIPAAGDPADRKRSRRRGEALEHAIQDAFLAELAEVGYARLTMEGVARRARTGKAALYRRWPTLTDLVIDTFAQVLVEPVWAPPETGSLRGDLLALLRAMAADLAGPNGPTVRALFIEVYRDPELAAVVRERLFAPRTPAVASILHRGLATGEVRPAVLANPQVVELGATLVINRFLFDGAPPDDPALVAIVDEMWLPLLRA